VRADYVVNKSRHPAASGTISSSCTQVRPLAASVCAYAEAGVNALKLNPAGLGDLAYSVFTSAEFHDNAKYLAKCYIAMTGSIFAVLP